MALLPFTPLMKPSSGIDANRWLEKCIDAIALASVDLSTREILCNICQMEMRLNQRMVDHHTHRGDDATSNNT